MLATDDSSCSILTHFHMSPFPAPVSSMSCWQRKLELNGITWWLKGFFFSFQSKKTMTIFYSYFHTFILGEKDFKILFQCFSLTCHCFCSFIKTLCLIAQCGMCLNESKGFSIPPSSFRCVVSVDKWRVSCVWTHVFSEPSSACRIGTETHRRSWATILCD